MDGLFRLREFWVRHAHINTSRLQTIDKKIEDTVVKTSHNPEEKLKRTYEPPSFSCGGVSTIGETKYNLQIVIPMYNAQKYICSCIDSILSQKTSYTFKIILVDDGSTDMTTSVVESRYKDKNIEIIRQANKGTASARNVGLKYIEADYIMFVDSDDVLKPDAVEILLNKAYENSACVVEGGYEILSGGIGRSILHQDKNVSELCGELWGFAWAKVFKAELFLDTSFPEGYWYEDTIVSYILYTKCVRAYTIKDVVYKYRNNIKGLSHIRGNDVKLLDSFWVLYYVIREMRARGIETTQRIYEAILLSMVTCCKRLIFMNDDIRKEVLEAFSELLNRDFKDKKSKDLVLAVFEKTVRNNDYRKFRKILVYIKE